MQIHSVINGCINAYLDKVVSGNFDFILKAYFQVAIGYHIQTDIVSGLKKLFYVKIK